MCASTTASLTTGTPTVSSVIYYAVLCVALIGFSIFDIKTRRVPNVALAVFLPFVLLAPVFADNASFLSAFLQALIGAAFGFGVLLLAGLVSKGGAGIGGGDIKLAGLLGFAFGPYEITAILLLAVILAVPAGLILRRKRNGAAELHLPFVPFMATGSLIATVITLFL
ncbi:MAG: A24 family peptidase [Oscillospiraceae bacterium]|nr:A24 family peptidase [Oscillospiraceae bacterium]